MFGLVAVGSGDGGAWSVWCLKVSVLLLFVDDACSSANFQFYVQNVRRKR